MHMPSMVRCGSSINRMRSLNVPGSDSSALHITYLGKPSAFAAPSHLIPVGNAAPPRPTRPEALISATTSSGFMLKAFLKAVYSPYVSRDVPPFPQLAVSIRIVPPTTDGGRPSSYESFSRLIFVSAWSLTSAAGACSQSPRQGLASLVRDRAG